MRIRQKAAWAIGITLAVLFAIMSGAARQMLARDFLRLENLAVTRSAERLHAGMENLREILRSQTGDWAYWDDTYRFARGENEAYEEDNLSASSVKTLALDLIAVLAPDGQPVFASGFDRETGERRPLPEGLAGLFRPDGYFTPQDPERLQDCRTGIVVLDSSVLLLASRQILTSQEQGPAAGTLVFGRILDGKFAENLADFLRYPVRLIRLDGPDPGPEARAALAALQAGGGLARPAPLDAKTLHGYTLLQDYSGRDALLVQYTMPREIMAEGRQTTHRLLAGLLLSGLVLAVVIFFGLQSTILSRLARLARDAETIRVRPDEAAGMTVRGDDEISALGLALNDMLAALQTSRTALASEKEHLAVTLRSIGDGVIVTDRQGNVRMLNKIAEALTGWATREARGRPLPEVFRIINAQTRETAVNPAERSLREGVIVGLANHTLLLARDGREHQIADSCAPIRDNRSEIIGAVLVFRDVTDDYGRREALKAANQMLEQVMNNIPQFIFWKDRKSVYLGCNENFAKVAGVASSREIAGKTDFDLAWKKEEAEFFHACGERVLDTGAAEYHIVAPQQQADGRQAWLDINLVPMLDDNDQVTGLLGTYEDITERRQLEEAQRRARALEGLGRVAGGIAHDFNNLLMGVFGNIELAELDLPPDHPCLAALQAAHLSLENARHLTARLLTFAKGGSPVLESVDLRQRICDTVRFHLAGGNVAAQFDIPDNLWPAKADRGQLAEVISNLTLNAKEAMPAGGTLHVRARNIPDLAEPGAPHLHGAFIQLVFRDEGVGIPASIIGRIFDPYFTTKQTGSGLGLAIVHGIIGKHNGHIRVESNPGAGATFTVFLPAETASPLRPAEPPLPAAGLPRSSGRILLMDDEAVVLETTQGMLVRLGFTVETARDGREAIAKYLEAKNQGRPFSATIMDLTIPGGMGGKEAIGELLARDPLARVIVSSGYSSDPVLADCTQYGFTGHLSKPFRLAELRDVIADAIGKPG